MTELQAQSLYKRIYEEAPTLGTRLSLATIGNGEQVCRIRMGLDLHFHIWSDEEWEKERWRFVTTRQKVESMV